MLGIVYHINKVPRYNVLLGLNATQASGREHTIAQKQYIEPWHAELPFVRGRVCIFYLYF